MFSRLSSEKAGSPPRMRGKASSWYRPRRSGRITPAHAGKRSRAPRGCCCSEDHPRVCGEKNNLKLRIMVRAGSPPHMRGKERRDRQAARRAGITPAHAGKRSRAPRGCCCSEDHPCTCGEKCTLMLRRRLTVGSPPHLRGKGEAAHRGLPFGGITPAHAGKSSRPYHTQGRK